MGNTVLKTESLAVGYGKKVVVDGLEIEVRPGEVLTIIGPNGAGKTTILKSISAQLPAISGSITVGSSDLADMSLRDISKTMAVCFTGRTDLERMTCEDVVSSGRYPYTGRLGLLSEEDRRIVRQAMELTGISALCDTDVNCISDGQRQTVMLARAVAQQPRVLILDEPSSFLDINNKLRLLSLLRELAKSRSIAVVQTLHELDLAQRFSDKILCVKDNKAQRIGAPEEIFCGDYISRLYGISYGTFLPGFGVAEAQKPEGQPQVFVIGGGGSGISTYRRLQRQGIPFAAGVLHENDVEYPVAKSLAAELITEKAFEPISEESMVRAREIMKKCSEVICCIEVFGSMNKGNRKLLEEYNIRHLEQKKEPEIL